ncbi:MAG TPA: DoxX family protein [Thermodesulfobacteriota bacterium]|nr:DoxX family protein [Thermodesulfobacteriota bacterium]
MEWLKGFGILIGRVLLVLIFLKSGINKIENFDGTAQYMASHGIAPYTNFFLIGAIFFELAGSITVILGYFARFGAVLLLIFLVPTTLIFHDVFTNPNQDIWIHFMKNVATFGGLLILLAVGAGRFSLDYFFRRGKK